MKQVDTGRLLRRPWYSMGREIVELYQRWMFQMDVDYQASIPIGPKILASNHPTTIDPMMMTTLVPEPVSILILDTLFKVPIVGDSLRSTGHIRVDPNNGRASMEEGVRCLRAGHTLGIFPEGVISPAEGGLHPMHTGAARLAVGTRAPIIPVGIAVQPEKIRRWKSKVDGKTEEGTWYLRGGYAITLGAPMYFRGEVGDREHVHYVTEQLSERITSLAKESQRRLEKLPVSN